MNTHLVWKINAFNEQDKPIPISIESYSCKIWFKNRVYESGETINERLS